MRYAALLIALSTQSGCDLGGVGVGIGDALDCAFDLEGYDARIGSDEEQLTARVQCEDGSDCADVRTVARGASFEVIVEVPADFANTELRIESSDRDVLTLEGFEPTTDVCDGGRELMGTASFDAVGEAAIVVYADDREIDRFTATADEPASLEIQGAPFGFAESNDWASPQMLAIDTTYMVRALLRSEDGARLVGGPSVHWSLPDHTIAAFDRHGTRNSEEDGRVVLLVPVALGSTTLQVEVGDLSESIEVEVTAVPEPDAGIGDEDASMPVAD